MLGGDWCSFCNTKTTAELRALNNTGAWCKVAHQYCAEVLSEEIALSWTQKGMREAISWRSGWLRWEARLLWVFRSLTITERTWHWVFDILSWGIDHRNESWWLVQQPQKVTIWTVMYLLIFTFCWNISTRWRRFALAISGIEGVLLVVIKVPWKCHQ